MHGTLTFECLRSDPLIRLVAESDGVTVEELVALLEAVDEAMARQPARAKQLIQRAKQPLLC
jgi:hypothetical protein